MRSSVILLHPQRAGGLIDQFTLICVLDKFPQLTFLMGAVGGMGKARSMGGSLLVMFGSLACVGWRGGCEVFRQCSNGLQTVRIAALSYAEKARNANHRRHSLM